MFQIANDYKLPKEAVTETFAILAKRGAGKTYLAMVMAEEMLKGGHQIVAVDPLGVWWGLRSSADGKSDGLPIVILGGDHADLPLTEDMGEVVARMVVESPVSVVLDLSGLRKNAQVRFMTAFADTLYYQNREPLHLFVDEADAYAPQQTMKGRERLLGAMEDIVRRGRVRGLGVTMITQRPAVLNKNVLTQIEVLLALRTTSPQDRTAIDDWTKMNGTPEQREELLGSLAKLETGTAWLWSPGWLDEFRQIKVRRRETFDSSSTPKVGKRAASPTRVTKIDLATVQEYLEASVEAAEANDVKALQRKIVGLQRQLSKKPEPEVVMQEVPVLDDETRQELTELAEDIIQQAEALVQFGNALLVTLGKVHESGAGRAVVWPRPDATRIEALSQALASNAVDEPSDMHLATGEIKILQAIVQRYPVRLTRAQIGTLSGYTASGGTFSKYFGNLRRQGLIEEANGETTATEEGLHFLGTDVPPAPETTDELVSMWLSALPLGAGKMLELLVDVYPRQLTRDDLGDITGYTASGGTFSKYLGMLRRNGLIDEGDDRRVAASSSLFIGA